MQKAGIWGKKSWNKCPNQSINLYFTILKLCQTQRLAGQELFFFRHSAIQIVCTQRPSCSCSPSLIDAERAVVRANLPPSNSALCSASTSGFLHLHGHLTAVWVCVCLFQTGNSTAAASFGHTDRPLVPGKRGLRRWESSLPPLHPFGYHRRERDNK